MEKKLSLVMVGTLLVAVLLISGCTSDTIDESNNNVETKAFPDNKAIIFKSPSCGCCVGYASYLEENGFEVELKATQDMSAIKEKYNIPSSMESCHTVIIGDYFVEGHVPVEAVNKLLEENPAIDGITLPRMPSGSPGMPGQKTETWRIYALSDGQSYEFMMV